MLPLARLRRLLQPPGDSPPGDTFITLSPWRELPRHLRSNIPRVVTSAGMSSSRSGERAEGCGVGWASTSARKSFRAGRAGEGVERRAASLGSMSFWLLFGAGRGAL